MFVRHRAKRIREVRDDETSAVPIERQHVVPQLDIAHFGDVAIGEADELFAFDAIDGIESFARDGRLPRLHFGDHDRAAAADDEIDLAVARPDVAREHAISAEAIKPGGAALAAAPEVARIESLTCDESASRCRCV